MEEAARGQGPCASGHHPGGGGGHGCRDAGVDKGAAGDAGQDAGTHCPSIVSVSSLPETPVAAKFDLSAAIDVNGASGVIALDWHLLGASAGTLQFDPATPNATFVCTAIGTQTVEVTVTGGDPSASCSSSASLAVDCTTLCGNGTVDPGEACDPPDGITCDATCKLLDHCPTIASVTAGMTDVFNKGSAFVSVAASDPDPGDNLAYAWSVTGGYVFQDVTTAVVEYMCTDVGLQTVTATVSDGKCSVSGSVDINCYAWCGDGVVSPGEVCDPPHTGPDGLQCSPSCQLLTCGNGVIDPGEQCDPPKSGACSTTCQVVLCGNGVLDPGEQCDPPLSGVCSATCQNVPVVCGDGVIEPGEACDPPTGPSSTNSAPLCDATCQVPICGNLALDPGEGCDPPNDTTCDRSCQPIPIACGNGIVQGIETCDYGTTTPAICRNCQSTNCGGCFAAVGGGARVCSGLDVPDTQACSALVTCTANNMGFCANVTGAACYCTAAATQPPSSACAAGPDGPCVAQFQALAHSTDPAVVMAQINDPATPVGKVATAMRNFSHSPCGSPCFLFNN